MYTYPNYGFYSAGTGALVWLIVAAVLALGGGIALYFTFLSKKNDTKFNGFLGWLYDFLTFKKMFIENLLRITYLIAAIFVTLYSFVAGSILGFFAVLVLGNISLRIMYEFSLILLVICRNTSVINSSLKKAEKKEIVNKEENN